MSTEYFEIPLKTEEVEDFELPKAKTSLNAIQNSPFCTLISMHKIILSKDIFNPNDELLVFDTEVEVPQYPKNDIRKSERVAIIFLKEDNFVPYVFALRRDFPEVIHENLFFKDYPKSLCIYEKSFDELKISWSSAVFIEDIRNWLKKTAKGELHQEEQQLEPLVLFYEGDIILPHDIKPGEKLYACAFAQKGNRTSILTSRTHFNLKEKLNFKLVSIIGKSQTHGVIKFTPQNLEDLHSFLFNAEINFKNELIKILKENKINNTDKLLFLIILPKKRYDTSNEINNEIHVYATIDSIKDIGIKIGLWQLFNNNLCEIWDFDIQKSNLKDIRIGLLKPHYTFNRKLAILLNDIENLNKVPNILAIGLGALGSQIFMNLARSGFGKWNLVDDDILLPHNLARHGLTSEYIFWPKVSALSLLANNMLSDNSFSYPLYTNILRQENEDDTKLLVEKINECDIVFDFSASISVPRYLCNNERFLKKRILSSFINPSGNYHVLLYEDKEKDITIDILEMLFYRELITETSLAHYFSYNENGEIRYSTSCRDLSSKIPQDYLSIHAANTSNFIKNNYQHDEATACIMYYNNSDFSLSKFNIRIPKIIKSNIADWEVIVNNILFDKIDVLRKNKLPKETGGILVGSWDVEYKRIYVLDTIIPENNCEYPSCFYRGIEGLHEKLERISKLTAGMLKYVGEWHSHPDGCPPSLSEDDLILLAWLTENMSIENLPALMMILGEDQQYNFYLGSTID